MERPVRMVTSSWWTPLTDEYARIGISRGTPRGQSGYRMYRKLAPGSWFASVSQEEYCRQYSTILEGLDPELVLYELIDLAGGRVPALLCFERPPPEPRWCHRGLVSAWFANRLGLCVPEYRHETLGYGWSHPKMPPQMSGLDLTLFSARTHALIRRRITDAPASDPLLYEAV
jgi:hypothetical protein